MGCKKDGVIPKEEVTLEGDQKLTDLFKEGDEIQAKVIKTDDGDGVILLSKKKLEVNEHWNEIVEALENKSIINVKVVKDVYKRQAAGWLACERRLQKRCDQRTRTDDPKVFGRVHAPCGSGGQ